MKILTFISRIVVGILFIISGLIKANDAIGFSYKLEEYFSPDVLNLEFLIPFAFIMAAAICVVEIVLGIMVIIGSRAKLTSLLLMAMILFFTFLTFYSAYFDKVTDCGCFGDAVKLTPWGSFRKDIILLFFITILLIEHKNIKSMLSIKKENMLIAIISFFSIAFVYHTYSHLPIKDFRPYAVGKNISDGMLSCSDLGLPCTEEAYFYIVKDKSSGQEIEILSTVYQDNWENYEFISSTDKTIVLQEGYEPPIHDFSISIDDFDYTSTILEQENALLFICYNINKTEDKSFDELNKLYDSVVLDSLASFIPLSASGYDDLQSFKLKNNVVFDFYFTDETTLKTIVRSNPGLVLLNKGTVVAKWHLNDIPDYESIKNLFIK
ncbi:DoxX family protein [Flavobacteriales bacterium]|nr:DoxX family protein [Flavobacteriales bacterium]